MACYSRCFFTPYFCFPVPYNEKPSLLGLIYLDEDLQDLLELTSKKDFLLIIGDWNAKVGSQEIPGVIKFGLRVQNEAGQILIEFCQENALVIVNTVFQQHKRKLYTWTSPDGQY